MADSDWDHQTVIGKKRNNGGGGGKPTANDVRSALRAGKSVDTVAKGTRGGGGPSAATKLDNDSETLKRTSWHTPAPRRN